MEKGRSNWAKGRDPIGIVGLIFQPCGIIYTASCTILDVQIQLGKSFPSNNSVLLRIETNSSLMYFCFILMTQEISHGHGGLLECPTQLDIFCRSGAKGFLEYSFCAAPSYICLLYTSPSPRDRQKSRMPSSA